MTDHYLPNVGDTGGEGVLGRILNRLAAHNLYVVQFQVLDQAEDACESKDAGVHIREQRSEEQLDLFVTC